MMKFFPSGCLLIYLLIPKIGVAQNSIPFQSLFFQEFGVGDRDHDLATFKPSLIEEVEFRTETDEFDFDRQRYALRFTPSSVKVNNSMKDLLNAYEAKFDYFVSENRKDSIHASYQTAITVYKYYLEEELQKKLLTVLEDQDLVYQKLLDAKSSYSVRWLDVKKEISELKSDLLEKSRRLSFYNQGNAIIDWSYIIGIDEIKETLEDVTLDMTLGLENDRYNVEQDILDKEIKLEEAEADDFFDFLQMEYRGPSINPWDERMSVTAAFRLPVKDNQKKLKIAELRNEKMELDYRLSNRQLRAKEEIREVYEDLVVMIDVYELELSSLEEIKSNSQKISNTYRTHTDVDPLFELQQKEMIYKQEISLARLRGRIVDTYIDLLSTKQMLYLQPFKNYLVKTN